jgi:type 1 fimbriae regulatory protein FimB/type 1 fimbriae regulatory protein FimE
MEAAGKRRYGHRDTTAILLAYRHGLRASELVALRWSDIDLKTGRLRVRRSRGGEAANHPLGASEIRALRRLQRETKVKSVYVFISGRGTPLAIAGYQRMVAKAGVSAKFPFMMSSDLLRHSCGYKLTNEGHNTRAIQSYLGHRSTKPIQRYMNMASAAKRFERFWKD